MYNIDHFIVGFFCFFTKMYYYALDKIELGYIISDEF